MNDSDLFCIRFAFGIPLEDIFPPNNIHPKLQDLLLATLSAAKASALSLQQLLDCNDLDLVQVFDLKDKIVNGQPRYGPDLCPSSLFWLLRHFFGQLPLPLFPTFTNGQTYNWKYLSARCRIENLRPNYDLESEISWCIHRLPKANVIMVYPLINFFRRICLRKGFYFEKKFDKASVYAIAKYFSASLFFRPYTPGFRTESEKRFFPILCYLIIRWSKIRREISWRFEDCVLSPSISSSEDSNHSIADCGCQTSCTIFKEEKVIEKADKETNTFIEENERCLAIVEATKTTGIEDITDDNKNVVKKSANEETTSKQSVIEGDKETNTFIEENKNVVKNSANEETISEQSVIESSNEEDTEISSLSSDSKPELEERTIAKNSTKLERKTEDNNEEQIEISVSSDSEPVYEEIFEEDRTTKIFTKEEQKSSTPKLLKQKISEANQSLLNAISKMKFKQGRSKSVSRIDKNKYNLLKNTGPEVTKTRSLPARHNTPESPYIKYKKLLTL